MSDNEAIAIVGMAARVPGADTLDAFWKIVRDACVTLTRYDRVALLGAGLPETLIDDTQFVPVYGTLQNVDSFDAGHFGYTPREARLMDPQQRLFLETAWHALEDAGIDPTRADDKTGVFAGCSLNRYLLHNLLGNPAAAGPYAREDTTFVPDFAASDYIASRVAFHLGLRGPVMAVQTACSTGLVAVAQACQSLIDFRCNMAIAGASSVNGRGPRGYLSEIEGMTSPRGVCAPLDATADGSVFGDGVGVVVLKRLEDALADNDPIRAVIRGWAVGNDGDDRAGFSSPGVTGQMETMMEAIAMAETAPADIGYVEVHGSATRVGDPIEIKALHRAFSALGGALGRNCALGSVKGNFGHLDAAAGIVSLIKTVLVIEHDQRPPVASFVVPNPLLELHRTGFFVPGTVTPFATTRRLAAVNSIGLGGTNAHVVLENTSKRAALPENIPNRPISLVLSANTTEALCRQLDRVAETAGAPSTSLTDAAVTLLTARAALPLRVAVAGQNWDDVGAQASRLLRNLPEPMPAAPDRPVVFAMTGTGLHYRGMAHTLARTEPIFRDALDDLRRTALREHDISLDWLTDPPTDKGREFDLRMLLRGGKGHEAGNPGQADLSIADAHAGIAAIQMAMTALLADKGLHPSRVMGHSLGEFAACYAAGMLDADATLGAVITRARLIESMPEGGMLSVPLNADAAREFCNDGVWIGAFNAPELVTLSARFDRLEALEITLRAAGHVFRRLDASRAYHSSDLAPISDLLTRALAPLSFAEPTVPLISNLTGTPLNTASLRNGRYWADHLVQPVQWVRSVVGQLGDPTPIFVEIGPGSGLCQLIDAIARNAGHACTTIATTPAEHDALPGAIVFQDALGAAWAAGHDLPARALAGDASAARTHLWTYPFERDVYWIDPPALCRAATNAAATQPIGTAPPSPAPLSNPSSGEFEASVRATFGGFFGRVDLGLDDDLIALGGHSLLALQISNAVWKAHRVEIPVRSILEARTLRRILANVDPPKQDVEEDSQEPLLARLAAQSLTSRIQTAERWVMDRMAVILDATNLHPDSVFGAGDMRRAAPDLIRSVHRDLDLRLYPNELDGSLTVHQIAIRIISALHLDVEYPVVQQSPVLAMRGERIPGVAFVLSSVRSGSTLLRVMLEGHPDLFAPPELHLARYTDMHERARFETSPDRDQGLVVALTDLYEGDRTLAEAMIDRFTSENWPIAEVFRTLRQAAAPRLFIDKSPGYANDPETLSRIETMFDAPRYVHLYRHPYSVIESVRRNRFTALMQTPGLDPEELGDYLWHRSNANISLFLGSIPDERTHALAYEDLVTNPETTARRLCAALGVDYVPAILTPYEGRRMRDGLGDPNLSDHGRIRPDLATAWRNNAPTRRLSSQTATLARVFGYDLQARDLPRSACKLQPPRQTKRPPLSGNHIETVLLRPERRRGARALVCLHALDGSVDLYRPLAHAIPVDGPVIGLGLTPDAVLAQEWTVPELVQTHADTLVSMGLAAFDLLGWSFGGLLAYEIAQLLKETAPVLLLDTPAPFGRDRRAEDTLHVLTSFVETLFATFRKPLPASLPDRLSGATDDDAAIDAALDALVGAGILPDTMFRNDLADRFRMYRTNTLAANRFERTTRGGAVRLLRVDPAVSDNDTALVHPNFRHADGAYGWSAIADVLQAQHITGTHLTMLLPAHAGAIAEAVSRITEEAAS